MFHTLPGVGSPRSSQCAGRDAINQSASSPFSLCVLDLKKIYSQQLFSSFARPGMEYSLYAIKYSGEISNFYYYYCYQRNRGKKQNNQVQVTPPLSLSRSRKVTSPVYRYTNDVDLL